MESYLVKLIGFARICQQRLANQAYKRRKAAENTPRFRYGQHKVNATWRGIPFLLTFEQWWNLWEPHWAGRAACDAASPVMARHGDTGPYAVGNVEIISRAKNTSDARRITTENNHKRAA